MDGGLFLVLAAATLAGGWFWWRRMASGSAEAHLRRICFGDQGQVDRLIEGEMRRAGGEISRAEAAHRAIERHRRDNH